MFTIGDIRNIAIQIEKNGEAAYRNASQAVKDPDIAEVLNWMADEEKRHAEWFADLRSAKPLTAEQLEMEAMGRKLLQDMIKGNSFLLDHKELETAESIKAVLTRSKTFEHDTIVFYQFLQGFLDDEETILQLGLIIEEERKHLKQLELMEQPEENNSCNSLCGGK